MPLDLMDHYTPNTFGGSTPPPVPYFPRPTNRTQPFTPPNPAWAPTQTPYYKINYTMSPRAFPKGIIIGEQANSGDFATITGLTVVPPGQQLKVSVQEGNFLSGFADTGAHIELVRATDNMVLAAWDPSAGFYNGVSEAVFTAPETEGEYIIKATSKHSHLAFFGKDTVEPEFHFIVQAGASAPKVGETGIAGKVGKDLGAVVSPVTGAFTPMLKWIAIGALGVAAVIVLPPILSYLPKSKPKTT